MLDPRISLEGRFQASASRTCIRAIDMTDDELAAIAARAKLTVV